MGTAYDRDVIARADEQAALIRARRFDELDLDHLADEIEDVNKSERRELASRMAVLIMHRLEWQMQPDRRGPTRETTFGEQGRRLRRALERTPSLRTMPTDPEWIEDIWTDGVAGAMRETGLDRIAFPVECPWPLRDMIRDGWKPD
ncbi:MAG: DUF29 domain-containing protein [Gluconacetobacter diazotrophicus]|nr:DUF29 domain-containing protein [Gluconacetobacter diazotrophicus]